MCLVLTLELHGEIEHRLLQKPTVRSQLIGYHRSELAAERRVEDVRVARRRIVRGLLPAVKAGSTKETDRGRGQYGSTRRREERPPSSEEMNLNPAVDSGRGGNLRPGLQP